MPKPKSSYDPIKERAKIVADRLWEKAVELANILAPDVPADHEQLPDEYQWMILERVAQSLSPQSWDDPDAILDLYRLRRKFAPMVAYEWLKDIAAEKRKLKRAMPRADITPENPEYDAIMRRLSR